MSSRCLYGKTVSDEQPDEQEQVREDGQCPECEGEVVMEEYEAVCSECGLVVDERFTQLGPKYQLKHVDKEEDKKGLETPTPYMLDEQGSPFQNAPLGVTFPSSRGDWRFDSNGNRLNGTYEKWDNIRNRQVKRVVQSRDNWRTDALQDIRTIGNSAGIPRHVCERATDLFRDAWEKGLAGGRMAFESLAAGAIVVAARQAGLEQGIDEITQWARTPHERACAGARKVRLGLKLVDETPPIRPTAVEDVVVELIGDGLLVDGLKEFQALTDHLMWVADKAKIGPGTPRTTVAGAAAHRAGILLGYNPRFEGPSSREVAEAVQAVVDTSQKRISRYSREIRDVYEDVEGESEADG